MVDSRVPAIAGLAAGAGILILFGIFFIPTVFSPPMEKTVISYEPTQCSTTPWAADWNGSHPGEPFRELAEVRQHTVILDYYERTGIAVSDVKYRDSISPACEGCNCTEGYIIDFTVGENDAGKLRENILASTVGIG